MEQSIPRPDGNEDPEFRRRAPRGSITRQRVVRGAIDLIDAEGLAALTMPRLAEKLGTGTMSLYRHVQSKADLVDAVATQVSSGLAVPSGETGDWQTRVVGYLLAWRARALAHPAIASIVVDHVLSLRSEHDHLEELLAILHEAGFEDDEAVRVFYSLFTYVLGFVVWELPRSGNDYSDTWDQSIQELPSGLYRRMHAAHTALATTASHEQFEFGLELLLGSINNRHAAAQSAETARHPRSERLA